MIVVAEEEHWQEDYRRPWIKLLLSYYLTWKSRVGVVSQCISTKRSVRSWITLDS